MLQGYHIIMKDGAQIKAVNADGLESAILMTGTETDITQQYSDPYGDTLTTHLKLTSEGTIEISAESGSGTAPYFDGLRIRTAQMNYYPDSVVTKAYIDALAVNARRLKGEINASTNPNYPTAQVGDTYHISAAGRIGGASGKIVNIGDELVCKTPTVQGDEATVGANFYVIESNRDQATTAIAGVTKYATTAQAIEGTAQDVAVTPAGISARSKKFTIGDGAATSFVLAHNLNTYDVAVDVVMNSGTRENVAGHIQRTSVNEVTVTFLAAPAANALNVYTRLY